MAGRTEQNALLLWLLALAPLALSPQVAMAEILLVADDAVYSPAPALTIRQFYVVTEKNPLSGEGVDAPRRFSSRLEAFEYRESLRGGVWVVWRYVGQNEPLRSVRFASRAAAEQFVRSEGPARRGLLGTVLLTDETRILPARVSLETEYAR